MQPCIRDKDPSLQPSRIPNQDVPPGASPRISAGRVCIPYISDGRRHEPTSPTWCGVGDGIHGDSTEYACAHGPDANAKYRLTLKISKKEGIGK